MGKIIHYPNLQTVLMVETILKKEKDITRTELKKKLPKKIMHQTLNVIIKYLEDSGKVIDHKTGIIWTYCPPEEMAKYRNYPTVTTEYLRKLERSAQKGLRTTSKGEKTHSPSHRSSSANRHRQS